MQAVAAINKLWIEGKYVMGEATLLNNEKANQLKSLIDNGIKISVSSRGVGTVKNGVVETFDLITYDLVDTPSDYNATMDGYITESVKSYKYNQNGMIVESVEDENECSDDKEHKKKKQIDSIDHIDSDDKKDENQETPDKQEQQEIEEKIIKCFNEFFNKLKSK